MPFSQISTFSFVCFSRTYNGFQQPRNPAKHQLRHNLRLELFNHQIVRSLIPILRGFLRQLIELTLSSAMPVRWRSNHQYINTSIHSSSGHRSAKLHRVAIWKKCFKTSLFFCILRNSLSPVTTNLSSFWNLLIRRLAHAAENYNHSFIRIASVILEKFETIFPGSPFLPRGKDKQKLYNKKKYSSNNNNKNNKQKQQ